MKNWFAYGMGLLFCLPVHCTAQVADNAELQDLYRADQAARATDTIDWSVVARQDSVRLARVEALDQNGAVRTAKDHYHAAMVFQHGLDTAASSQAVRHMRAAIARDSGINKWLLAAAIDRDLMRRDEPQIYGTQYEKGTEPGARWRRYKIDSTTVSDAERRYYGVETLREQHEKEQAMNRATLASYPASLAATLALIRTERQRGAAAAYDVSEDGINTFGYVLMQQGKLEDALKIFQLNTELHPTRSNPFDSYGECLLKLGRKKEALAAYQRAVALDPQNANARQQAGPKMMRSTP